MFLFVAILCLLASANAKSTRITNGENVSNVVPSYAYVEVHRLPGLQGDSLFGGGSLISTQAILTVAQNVANFQSWRVGLGAIQVSQLQWFDVATSHVHPEFNAANLAHNIAVLRLSTAVPIAPNTMPINRLPGGIIFPPAGNVGIVVGFGFDATLNQPTVLQQARLTALSDVECGNFYPHLVINNQLENHFCALNNVTGANICAGDQGGPIYTENGQLLIGVQSFNRAADCGSIDAQPGAFLRLGNYDSFINQFW